eukprot:scaffold314317_cov24-Prasinocladus_malaysianus.AAC.1
MPPSIHLMNSNPNPNPNQPHPQPQSSPIVGGPNHCTRALSFNAATHGLIRSLYSAPELHDRASSSFDKGGDFIHGKGLAHAKQQVLAARPSTSNSASLPIQ